MSVSGTNIRRINIIFCRKSGKGFTAMHYSSAVSFSPLFFSFFIFECRSSAYEGFRAHRPLESGRTGCIRRDAALKIHFFLDASPKCIRQASFNNFNNKSRASDWNRNNQRVITVGNCDSVSKLYLRIFAKVNTIFIFFALSNEKRETIVKAWTIIIIS